MAGCTERRHNFQYTDWGIMSRFVVQYTHGEYQDIREKSADEMKISGDERKVLHFVCNKDQVQCNQV